MIVRRPVDESRLADSLAFAPVVVLTGPRQAGKSTLARMVVTDPGDVFDLENPDDVRRLHEPMLALADRTQTIVIDEAQRMPELFPVLRVLVDADRRPGRFLVLGSASPELVGMSSESLTGRAETLELSGLRVLDVGAPNLDRLWLRGGLPPAYLAGTDDASARWRAEYVTSFVERDLANLGFRTPASTMRRFWTMLAHYHGQTWNGAELGRALGMSANSVRRYLDALTDALVVRQLTPWYANVSKRQVRSPKIYVRDTGLLHRLLDIRTQRALHGHPKVGASWEGFVIEQLLGIHRPDDPSFWATQSGAELDLRTEIDGRLIGVEVKRSSAPTMTPSIRSALDDLSLDHVYVVHAGTKRYRIVDKVTAVPATEALMGALID